MNIEIKNTLPFKFTQEMECFAVNQTKRIQDFWLKTQNTDERNQRNSLTVLVHMLVKAQHSKISGSYLGLTQFLQNSQQLFFSDIDKIIVNVYKERRRK